MAYVSPEVKAQLAPAIKAVLKKFGMKGTIAVRHHSTLVLNIREGSLDLIGNYNRLASDGRAPVTYVQVNEYHLDKAYSGRCLQFLTELLKAMRGPDFYDRSDSQTDYFDVSHYTNINIGAYDKQYRFIGGPQ